MLFDLVMDYKKDNYSMITIKSRIDIWIRSEISLLEIMSLFSNVDNSNEIKKYKRLL